MKEQDLRRHLSSSYEDDQLPQESPAELSADPESGGGTVLAPQGPFEAPAREMVPGAYFASIEEVMPELAATDAEVAGDHADPTDQPYSMDRRDFMKLFSLSALAAGTGACLPRPVEKVVPYVDHPIDTVPGIAKHYATTCGSCRAACGVSVKTKDGRPIKLEGLEGHRINKEGSLCAVGQASIQELYHPERLSSPQMRSGGRWLDTSWSDVWERLGGICAGTQKIGILTHGVSSHARELYHQFIEALGGSGEDLYTWNSNGLEAVTARAHKLVFGQNGLPRLRLSKARLVVGVGSDVLETGLSPVEHTHEMHLGLGYQPPKGVQRAYKGRFVQFESVMSLTGAKADERHTVPVGSELAILLWLLEEITNKVTARDGSIGAERAVKVKALLKRNRASLATYKSLFSADKKEVIGELAGDLLSHPEHCVVLAGGASSAHESATQLQLVAIYINELLGAYASGILDFEKNWIPSSVGEEDLTRFMARAAQLDVLLVINHDPITALPQSWRVDKVLQSITTVVSLQPFPRPMDGFAQYVLPIHHYLESWGDEEISAGVWSLRQPALRAISDSRQAEDTLLWIAAGAGKPMGYRSYRDYLWQKWQDLYQGISGAKEYSLDRFIHESLKKGMIDPDDYGSRGALASRPLGRLFDISDKVTLAPRRDLASSRHLRLIAPYDQRLGEGLRAHIPILQEIGNPMTTIAWDSYAAINPFTCRALGVKRNDVIRVYSSDKQRSIKVAVFPLPGVARDALVIPQGGGIKDKRNTVAHEVGVQPLDVIPLSTDSLSGELVSSGVEVIVENTTHRYRLAAMQKHNDIANRSDVYRKVGFGKLERKIAERKEPKDLDDVPDLYPSLDKPEIYMHFQRNVDDPAGGAPQATIDYRWGMSIDLDRCTGCGACMVACSLENNVPQVGRDQINLGREMFWVRLDRYFDGPVDEPGVSFQPVMCQQCNHAPCEAVCPVYATTHDPEGINAMTYNRCVGTRYCANACPYKVRRFNWWTHKFGVVGKKLRDRTPRALNPDVTVRTRGVMEKCNFCVGRLRDAKHEAKERKRASGQSGSRGGTGVVVQTACQQTCPASAITFGNLKEPTLASQLRASERAYLMLGGDPDHKHYGIKTLPNVSYLAQVVHDGTPITFPGDIHSHSHSHNHSHSHREGGSHTH